MIFTTYITDVPVSTRRRRSIWALAIGMPMLGLILLFAVLSQLGCATKIRIADGGRFGGRSGHADSMRSATHRSMLPGEIRPRPQFFTGGQS